MATIRKRGNNWLAEVRLRGAHKAKTFATKAKAAAWAAQTEADIIAGKEGKTPNKTFGQLLERYAAEVSPTHRGARWEAMRVGLTLRDPIAQVKLADLDERAVAGWRDRRLAQVSPASVRREWNLLSSACTVAMNEWKWLSRHPMKTVKRPAVPEARDRTATDDELDRILFVLGDDLTKVTGRVGMAVRFALETAMRAGEIANLRWDDIEAKHCRVLKGKTSAAKRAVPLSPEAVRIIQAMPKDAETVFNLVESQIDAHFRKAKAKALVSGLRFHDLRHTAITRLAKKLDVLALARMVGHKDLRMLMIYYNPSADDLANRL